MPKTAPVLASSKLFEIISKFVEPVNPYIREHPYNNNPDASALSTKYFNPASVDLKSSLLKDAKIYRHRDCNSKPR